MSTVYLKGNIGGIVKMEENDTWLEEEYFESEYGLPLAQCRWDSHRLNLSEQLCLWL